MIFSIPTGSVELSIAESRSIMDRTPLTFESRRPNAHGLYRRCFLWRCRASCVTLVFMDVALAQEVEPAAVDLADISQQLNWNWKRPTDQ